MKNKKEIRKYILKKRQKLSEAYRETASEKIHQHILSSSDYKRAQTIFIYYSVADELDSHNLINRAIEDNKRIALPRVMDLANRSMNFYEYRLGDVLEISKFGIPEPRACSTRLLSPVDADLLIVPCVSANKRGERIGYGAGLYDKFLQNYSVPNILPIFEVLVYEEIPLETHDKLVQSVVTENGIFNRHYIEHE